MPRRPKNSPPTIPAELRQGLAEIATAAPGLRYAEGQLYDAPAKCAHCGAGAHASHWDGKTLKCPYCDKLTPGEPCGSFVSLSGSFELPGGRLKITNGSIDVSQLPARARPPARPPPTSVPSSGTKVRR